MEIILYKKKVIRFLFDLKKHHLIKVVYITKNFNNTLILNKLKKLNIKIKFVVEKELFKLTKVSNHQNIACKITLNNHFKIEELLKKIDKENKKVKRLLIVDQLHDPLNFGAIIRSANLLNFDGIIYLEKKQTQLSNFVFSASAGAIVNMNFSKLNNINNIIKFLKDNNFIVCGSFINFNDKYKEIILDNNPNDKVNYLKEKNIALLIGNEAKGLSNKLKKHIDYNLLLKKWSALDSYNVSVAFALIGFLLKK